MPRILLVEDDTTLRLVTSAALEDSGFQVDEAASAAEAIETLQRESEIDLVFTNVQMPGDIDGFGLVEWIQLNRPELVVMITSAYWLRDEASEHLRTGERFIRKPADPFHIVDEIRAALTRDSGSKNGRS